MKRAIAVAAILVFAGSAQGETLKVGAGEKFAKPSEAFAAAKEGDIVEIAGDFSGDVATIRSNKLTIKGVGKERTKIAAGGKNAGGKAIWITAGKEITIENIEFSGARVPDKNGAGIRAEGSGLTLRNCRFYDCENGILGGNGEMLIEHCAFAHCGPVAEPATHSLYIGMECTKLTFQFNYSTDVIQGHLLKSRAKENWILYNRLTDENGTGSAVADFPNGGYVVMLGNILQKGPNGNNSRVIAYGFEGIKHEKNALFVVNNTLLYENRRPNAFYADVKNSPADFSMVFKNNLCVGKIPLTNLNKYEEGGNVLIGNAEFVDQGKYDYRLTKASFAIDKGVPPGKAGDFDLTPKFEYVHPAKSAERKAAGALDAGAYEFVPAK